MDRIIKILKYYLIIVLGLSLFACHKAPETYQGYIETRLLYVSSDFNGILKKLFYHRGQSVKVGDLLYVLENEPQLSSLKNAKALVTQAEAEQAITQQQLKYAETLLNRRIKLLKTKNIDPESIDIANDRYNTAKGNAQTAAAKLAEAKAQLNKELWSTNSKNRMAEKSGQIFDTYYQPGEMVIAGQPVLSILVPDELRIIFFVPERDLVNLYLGKIISFVIDGTTKTFQGKITFISQLAEYSPPVVYTNERKNKLVFRVELTPEEKDMPILHPGQPVSVDNLIISKKEQNHG